MSEQKQSYDLVDPELRSFIDQVPEVPLNKDSLAEAREGLNQMLAQMFNQDTGDTDVTQTEVFIDGPDDNQKLRLLVFQPKSAPKAHPIYLDIHGGGRILGIADMDNQANQQLASEFGVTVVSVDYRLAPETKHPGPLEDCYTALKWVKDHASDYDASPDKIAIGGASAGGGLAASLAILARDRKEVDVKFQDLQVPMLNDQTSADPNLSPYLGEFVWNAQQDYFGWESYLNGKQPGSKEVTPYESASRLTDFKGLPPAFINIGAIELFADDCIDYAKNLLDAGVPTELHVYPGVYHGGYLLAPDTAISQQMIQDRHDALKRAFERM